MKKIKITIDGKEVESAKEIDEAFSCSSQFSGWKSAYLNLSTAKHDLEAAQDGIATQNFEQAMESLRFAKQQIESAEMKISNATGEPRK